MLGLDVLLGGVTGLLGNAFTTWFKFKNAKLEYAHEEKMIELNTQALIERTRMQIEATKVHIAGEIELADSEAYKVSQQSGQKRLFHEKWIDMLMSFGDKKWFGWFFILLGTIISGFFALVDWLNSMMRPALTIYLIGASTWITLLAWKIMKQYGITLTASQAVDIFTQVTSTMIYLSVSAVTWWYGDRTMSKYLQERGRNSIERERY